MPTVPAAAPPLWSSDDDYTNGPDALTPTKVDSTSFAAEGHVPGKDFPTPGQIQNDWQFKSSEVSIFGFDSITALATPAATNDPRHVTTDSNGKAGVSRLEITGNPSQSGPSLDIKDSSTSDPAAIIRDGGDPNGDSQAMLECLALGNLSLGYAIKVDSRTNPGARKSGIQLLLKDHNELAGLHISVDGFALGTGRALLAQGGGLGVGSDPFAAAEQEAVSFSNENQEGIVLKIADQTLLGTGARIIAVEGGDGTATVLGGDAISARGGANLGAGAGYAIRGYPQSNLKSVIFAETLDTALIDTPAIQGVGTGSGIGVRGDSARGFALYGKATDDLSGSFGVSLHLAPQTFLPNASADTTGNVWMTGISGGGQVDMRVQQGLTADGKRWVSSYRRAFTRLAFNNPSLLSNTLGIATPTTILSGLAFSNGNEPVASHDVIVEFTCQISRDTVVALDTDSDNLAITFLFFDDTVSTTIAAHTVTIAMPSGWGGGPSASNPIWSDRNWTGNQQEIYWRRPYTIPNTGPGNFRVTFYRGTGNTGMQVRHSLLTMETAE